MGLWFAVAIGHEKDHRAPALIRLKTPVLICQTSQLPTTTSQLPNPKLLLHNYDGALRPWTRQREGLSSQQLPDRLFASHAKHFGREPNGWFGGDTTGAK